MDNENKRTISRRDFFKIAGAAGMATAGLAACGDRKGMSSSTNAGEPGGEMRTTDAPVVFSLWTMTAAPPSQPLHRVQPMFARLSARHLHPEGDASD